MGEHRFVQTGIASRKVWCFEALSFRAGGFVELDGHAADDVR